MAIKNINVTVNVTADTIEVFIGNVGYTMFKDRFIELQQGAYGKPGQVDISPEHLFRNLAISTGLSAIAPDDAGFKAAVEGKVFKI